MKYRITYPNYFISVRFNYAVKHFREWMNSIELFPFEEDTNDKN